MTLEQQRIKLAFLPTPIHELPRVTKHLNGPRILIKRDDLTGLALGGNKTRKLEYLFGDALKHDIDTIVTAGAVQSNHCRQTAAAAAQLGLRCELLLNGKPPQALDGSTLLDNVLGANIHWQGHDGGPNTLEELAQRVRAAGHKPYIIPYGGSNAFGTMGYVNAMVEIMQQQEASQQPITHIILASCSGATQAGLVVGAQLANFTGKIIGISVDYDESQKAQYQQDHVDLANATAAKLGLDKQFTSNDFAVEYAYATGYGIVKELERNAIHLLAGLEGILLDPVYSGRAFGALIDMIEKGNFSENDTILFLHTGGAPALFPYASKIVR